MFLRKEYYGTEERQYKLAGIAEEPLEVLYFTAEPVVKQDDKRQERISRDRIV